MFVLLVFPGRYQQDPVATKILVWAVARYGYLLAVRLSQLSTTVAQHINEVITSCPGKADAVQLESHFAFCAVCRLFHPR